MADKYSAVILQDKTLTFLCRPNTTKIVQSFFFLVQTIRLANQKEKKQTYLWSNLPKEFKEGKGITDLDRGNPETARLEDDTNAARRHPLP